MTDQFIPIAIILKTDLAAATASMETVDGLLREEFGDNYGITIYEGGSDIPTIAFFNDHDSEGDDIVQVEE